MSGEAPASVPMSAPRRMVHPHGLHSCLSSRAEKRSHNRRSYSPFASTRTRGRLLVEATGEMINDMPDERIDLPQGTLDLLILKTLALEPLHGWAISERIQQISNEAVQVQQGSLYPALHRLERRGWLRPHWATTESNRRAKYYELTAAGRKQLMAETKSWRKLAAAVASVLDMA